MQSAWGGVAQLGAQGNFATAAPTCQDKNQDSSRRISCMLADWAMSQSKWACLCWVAVGCRTNIDVSTQCMTIGLALWSEISQGENKN